MYSINITPVHPVSVLHSYLMPLWTYQNVLHIIVNTYAGRERLETRRERNHKREASEREWQWTEQKRLCRGNVLVSSTCRTLRFQTFRVCTWAGWDPGQSGDTATQAGLGLRWRPTRAQHRGRTRVWKTRQRLSVGDLSSCHLKFHFFKLKRR